MKKILMLIATALSCATMNAQRETLFNDGWTFSGEDADCGVVLEKRAVTLPHDWSILLPTQADAPMGNDGGYFPAGKGLYVKEFKTDERWRGRRNSLLFEGVYMNARVVLNGKEIGRHEYGWTPFELDITDALNYNGQNKLEVFVDNSEQRNCRWYTGSGIYRNVWLRSLPATDAISDFAVKTRKSGKNYSLDVSLAPTPNQKSTRVTATLADDKGRIVAQGALPLTVKAPREWSPKTPALYTLTLKSATDEVSTKIGFRTIEYSAEKGLSLNGEPILLSGACVHHDNGPLGACAYKDAETRRVKLLKTAGFNAVRTSHNPPSTAFLDACDSIGLLVIDEIFDGWRTEKTPHDYSTLFDNNWQSDVDCWVRRDVNHPSIWCWSVGNEVMERTEPECVMTARKLIGRVHSLDPYRPVTSAMCSWGQGWERFDTLMAEHDICGYNYYLHEAPNDHKRVSSRVIMQTESFPREAAVNYHRVKALDCVIGDFVWTGIDYLGESGIGRNYYEGQTPGEHYQAKQFPWHGAYCGDIDLIGWRKPISYLRELLYNDDEPASADGGKETSLPYIAVKEPDGYYGKTYTTSWSVWPTWPRWTWKGWEGKPIEVEIYTHAPKVRLFLNNKLVGEAETKDCTAAFTLNYAPGTLRAEALAADGSTLQSSALRTALKAKSIKLETQVYGELTYITATIVDKNGTPVPELSTIGSPALTAYELTFSAEGTELIATATADLTDLVPYPSNIRKTWNSMAQAIVRTKPGASVKVTGKGLESGMVTIK